MSRSRRTTRSRRCADGQPSAGPATPPWRGWSRAWPCARPYAPRAARGLRAARARPRARAPRRPRELPVPAKPKDPDSPRLRCLAIRLGRTKTGTADEDQRVLAIGRAADALTEWVERAGI